MGRHKKSPEEKAIRIEYTTTNHRLSSNQMKVIHEKGGKLFQLLFNKDVENAKIYLAENLDLDEATDEW